MYSVIGNCKILTELKTWKFLCKVRGNYEKGRLHWDSELGYLISGNHLYFRSFGRTPTVMRNVAEETLGLLHLHPPQAPWQSPQCVVKVPATTSCKKCHFGSIKTQSQKHHGWQMIPRSSDPSII